MLGGVCLGCVASSSTPPSLLKRKSGMEAPTLLPLLLLLAVKMGRFLESLGNFFTGGDNIPWRDRDIIAVSTRELPPLSASI